MPPGMDEPALPSASPTNFIHSGSASKAVDEIVAANASAAILKENVMMQSPSGESAGRGGAVGEVVERGDAVGLRPHANCPRPADVIILLRDVNLAVERNANRLSGEID